MLSKLRRRLTAQLLVLAGLVAPASAGERQVIAVEGVNCTASYSWPKLLNHGYFPISVELWNKNEGAVVVEFEAEQQWGGEDRVRNKLRLEGKERYSFEPLLRARAGGMNKYNLKFIVNGEDNAMAIGADDWSGGGESCVLLCSERPMEAGATERWSADWVSRSTSREYVIGDSTYDELSEQWSAYTSLDAVVLDTNSGLPRAAVLDALFQWCRAGGRLVLCGANPEAALRDRPADRKWIGDAYAFPAAPGYRRFHVGHGCLVLIEDSRGVAHAMETPGSGEPPAFQGVDGTFQPPWNPSAWTSTTPRMTAVSNLLEGFGSLPLRGLMILMVLFALLMGPLNFWWVKRSKKPMYLLMTVPAISIVASIALVMFGVLSQGLDVKSSTRSYTFLDQVDQVATTAEVRRIFAGSSPGEGLRPELGTALFPGPQFWRGNFRAGNLFTQDLSEGRLYGGDYLPVRRPAIQLILSDRPSRLKLGVTAIGEELEVANALGGDIEALVLRDEQGRFYKLKGGLDAGDTQRLVGGLVLEDAAEWEAAIQTVWGDDPDEREELPHGSYMAVVDARDLRDDCGISVNELNGRHYVFGVYASGSGGRR